MPFKRLRKSATDLSIKHGLSHKGFVHDNTSINITSLMNSSTTRIKLVSSVFSVWLGEVEMLLWLSPGLCQSSMFQM